MVVTNAECHDKVWLPSKRSTTTILMMFSLRTRKIVSSSMTQGSAYILKVFSISSVAFEIESCNSTSILIGVVMTACV